MADAKQVEAKAARIKDWVTNKLRELEEQNQHLREQNAYCNEQMELLRNRLERIQELGQECSKANSRRESTAEVGFVKINVMTFFLISVPLLMGQFTPLSTVYNCRVSRNGICLLEHSYQMNYSYLQV